MDRLPTRVPRLETESDVRRRMDEIREHYAPFTRNLAPATPVRHLSEPLNPWRFRYLEGGPEGGDEWREISLPEYKGRSSWAGEYFTTFLLPTSLLEFPRLLFQFDGVETNVDAWLNGVHVGSHSGGSDPFCLDITDVIDRAGQNELHLKVINGLSVNGIGYQRVFSLEPYRPEGTPYKLVGEWGNMNGRAGYAGGIWRDVKLLGRAESWISGALFHPDPENSRVTFQIDCQTKPGFSGRLNVDVIPRNFTGVGASASVEIELSSGESRQVEASIDIPDQHWWSPDEPYLYTARATLLAGAAGNNGTVDLKEYGFGQRTYRWDDSIKRYRLNGVPYRFRGTTTINSLNMAYVRGDIEFLVDQILLAKAAGFTMFRHHIMSPIHEINDYLDAYGMLSQPEMPIWGRFHHDLIDPAMEQLPRIVRQHYNHPSTVLFAISSESAMEREAYAEYQPQAIKLMETHFPNLEWKIEGVRGNLSGIPGARAEWGNLLEYKPGLYDAHEYPGWYVNLGSLEPVRDGETLMTIGEFGPESLPNVSTMRDTWPLGAYPNEPSEQLSRSELPFGPQYSWEQSRWFLPTPLSLNGWISATQNHSARVHRYLVAIYRRSPSVIGYHQYFLNEPVWNTWRKTICGVDLSPKRPFFAMAHANAPVFVDLYLEQGHFQAGDPIQARLFVANDSTAEIEGATVRLFLTNPEGEVVWAHSIEVSLPVAAPFEVDLPIPLVPPTATAPPTATGTLTLHAFLTCDGQTLADDRASVRMIDGETWPTAGPRVSGESAPILHFAANDAAAAVGNLLHGRLGNGYRTLSTAEIERDTSWNGALIIIDGVAEWEELPTQRIVDHLRGGGCVLMRELEPGDLGWLVPGLEVVADSGRALFRPDENHPLFAGPSTGGEGGLTSRDFHLWNFVELRHPISANLVMPYAGKRTRDLVECPLRFRGREFNRTAHISKDNTIRIFSVADADRDAAALLEVEYGAGRALICQAGVNRRYRQHPLARILLHREIEYLLSAPAHLRREKFDTISRF